MPALRQSPTVRRAAVRPYRLPSVALDPAAFTIEAAEEWALARAAARAFRAATFRLNAVWSIDYVIQHAAGERKTRYTARLMEAEYYGIAFGRLPAGRGRDRDLVGLDARAILREGRFRDDLDRVALTDLLMGAVAAPAPATITPDAAFHAKYVWRARRFAAEAARVLRHKGRTNIKGSRPRVLVIGATAGIIGALGERGFCVGATDLDGAVVERRLGGVRVRDGRTENPGAIAAADLVIITGMAMPNRTLCDLVARAREHDTSVMIWAITGRNFGSYYVRHGVDCVIADPSPFFLLPGPARVSIWRRTR
jgi:Putative heavy-metal chelation